MTEENPASIVRRSPKDTAVANPIHAVGVGPGNEAFLTRKAIQIVEIADVAEPNEQRYSDRTVVTVRASTSAEEA